MLYIQKQLKNEQGHMAAQAGQTLFSAGEGKEYDWEADGIIRTSGKESQAECRQKCASKEESEKLWLGNNWNPKGPSAKSLLDCRPEWLIAVARTSAALLPHLPYRHVSLKF